MKKKMIGLLLGVMVLFPGLVWAEEIDNVVENDILVSDYTADETYFNSGEDITSDKILYHNYFIAGNNVESNDYVSGILFAAGNDVKTLGITDYAFIAGNTLSIKGINYNDMFLAGNEITFEKESTVSRDVYAVGSKITINTTVEGNVYVAAGELDLSDAIVMGNINAYAETITVNDQTQILGTINYNSNAEINGNLQNICNSINSYNVNSDTTENTTTSESVGSYLADKLVIYLSLLLVAVVIMLVYPKIYDKMETKVDAGEYLAKLGKGLLFLIALPIAALILVFTTIGIPLAIISLLLYGIMIYLSYAMSGLVLGKTLFEKFNVNTNKYVVLAVGILLVKILTLLPFVGGLFNFIFLTIGLWLIIERFIPNKKTVKKD